MKYIMISVKQAEMPERFVPIIFPHVLVHSMVFDAVRPLLEATYEVPVNIRSAGEVIIATEYATGQSETLGVEAHESDARIIDTYDYYHGIA